MEVGWILFSCYEIHFHRPLPAPKQVLINLKKKALISVIILKHSHVINWLQWLLNTAL